MAVLVVFGLVWVAVAGLAALKVRSETRMASVEGFQRQLRSFGGGLPPLPEPPALEHPRGETAVRRTGATEQRLRIVLAALLVAVAISFVAALLVSTRTAWGLHLLIDDCLLAYLALLVRRRDRKLSAGRLSIGRPPRAGWQRRRPRIGGSRISLN